VSRIEVLSEIDGPVLTVVINRPEVRNAVDATTARQLFDSLKEFDRDPSLSVAVLTGAGGTFCAGADLKAIASGDLDRINPLDPDMEAVAPMGPTRLMLSKPVIAAVEGYAVAGGMELACWCDLRVAGEDAVFGVFDRRYGVPLIDGGTQRLPRLVGMSRAMDMILTGRAVGAKEALEVGLVNRLVPNGSARVEAVQLARQLAGFPQVGMRADRRSAYEGLELRFYEGMKREFEIGLGAIESGEAVEGATEFSKGMGKHGGFE
jgi:enoyl-CoA hydratase